MNVIMASSDCRMRVMRGRERVNSPELGECLLTGLTSGQSDLRLSRPALVATLLMYHSRPPARLISFINYYRMP